MAQYFQSRMDRQDDPGFDSYCDSDSDLRLTVLRKDEEYYVFVWREEHKAELLRTLGRFAGNPDLSFSWYDAAIVSQKVRGNTVDADIGF